MKRRVWTEEDLDYLRQNYGIIPVEDIIEKFGVNKQALIQCCFRHGINSNRYFSKDEEEYIIENFGRLSARTIAKKLGRSYDSVKVKIYRMGLGRLVDNSDKLHLAEVSRMVNKDKETIKTTWVRHGLKIQKVGKYSMISQDNLAKVMKNNPHLYDATECDDYFEFYDWFHKRN